MLEEIEAKEEQPEAEAKAHASNLQELLTKTHVHQLRSPTYLALPLRKWWFRLQLGVLPGGFTVLECLKLVSSIFCFGSTTFGIS